jgi:hypothetical protein
MQILENTMKLVVVVFHIPICSCCFDVPDLNFEEEKIGEDE